MHSIQEMRFDNLMLKSRKEVPLKVSDRKLLYISVSKTIHNSLCSFSLEALNIR